MKMRLQKALAEAGFASRRAQRGAHQSRQSHRRRGDRRELGASADPETQVIAVDGRPIAAETKEYWLLNKPAGVLSAVTDAQGKANGRRLRAHSGADLPGAAGWTWTAPASCFSPTTATWPGACFIPASMSKRNTRCGCGEWWAREALDALRRGVTARGRPDGAGRGPGAGDRSGPPRGGPQTSLRDRAARGSQAPGAPYARDGGTSGGGSPSQRASTA